MRQLVYAIMLVWVKNAQLKIVGNLLSVNRCATSITKDFENMAVRTLRK